eukprot:2875011-Rhodomonas_salina.1
MRKPFLAWRAISQHALYLADSKPHTCTCSRLHFAKKQQPQQTKKPKLTALASGRPRQVRAGGLDVEGDEGAAGVPEGLLQLPGARAVPHSRALRRLLRDHRCAPGPAPGQGRPARGAPVSYTHLRAHETEADL